jgi:putative ABC transport system ATP-binding protein
LSDLKFGWTPGRPLLKIAHFSVARGEKALLQGPSGCSKSTLLGLIGGVLEPASGSISVLGESLQTKRRQDRDHFRASHVGFIFQMFNLIPYLSILDNVLLPLEFSRERRMNLDTRGLQPGTEARRLLPDPARHQ